MVGTTFGGNTPAVSQRPRPSPATVQGNALLCASIAASTLCVFFTILTECVLRIPINAQGSTSGHDQNRQQKFKAWIFRHLRGWILSTALAAVILCSYGTSRICSEFSTAGTVALLGVTGLSVGLYLVVVVMAVVDPYFSLQTAESRIIRWTVSVISSAFRRTLKYSKAARRFF